MPNNLRLLAVLAHPDDESLGFGGTLAHYASEGVQTFLVTATRGENGRHGAAKSTSPEHLGRIREAELLEASNVLGIRDVSFLDYIDGALDRVDPVEAVAKIALHIRRVRPQVVMTFGPDGAYGHPDHIAISQLTTSAIVSAAYDQRPVSDPVSRGYPPHLVSKLYYMAWPRNKWDAYQAALKKLTSKVDGVDRQATPWPDWAVTTVINTAAQWPVVWQAVSCHESQMSIYQNLQTLGAEQHQALWGTQEFYRAFSVVNNGRHLESDIFEGLRDIDHAMEDQYVTARRSGAAPEAHGGSRTTA